MAVKRIAIVTGATGGIGSAFVDQLINESIDEIWCIARNKTKLDDLKQKYGNKIIPISMDLSVSKNIVEFEQRLKENKANIVYLINNAGVGDFIASYKNTELDKSKNTIDLNCTAVMLMCEVCIPYMKPGAKILNISSQASFQPLPYVNVYAASKAFVTSYTRALNVELKATGITATTVCPGWVETELLPKTRKNIEVKYPGIVSADRVATQALKDAKKNKEMSVITKNVKWMRFITKIFPHSLIMKSWTKGIEKYI